MDWLKIMQHRYRLTDSDFSNNRKSELRLACILLLAYVSFLIYTGVYK